MNFDFATAWYEVIQPRLNELEDLTAAMEIVMNADKSADVNFNRNETLSDELVTAFQNTLPQRAWDVDGFYPTLALMYFSGHLCPSDSIESSIFSVRMTKTGVYWKFSKLYIRFVIKNKLKYTKPIGNPDFSAICIEKDKYNYPEKYIKYFKALRNGETPNEVPYPKDDKDVVAFLKIMNRKTLEWFKGRIEITECTTVNHRIKDGVSVVKGEQYRRGMYMIGPEHLRGSGMFINSSLPCHRTGNKREDFIWDTVLILKIFSEEDVNSVKDFIGAIPAIAALEKENILSGLALVKGWEGDDDSDEA